MTVFVIFLALLIVGIQTQQASASTEDRSGTIPPGPDNANYGVFLPQAITADDDQTDPDDDKHIDDKPTGVCPTTSTAVYASLPVDGPPADRPPPVHADLNLSVRSYVTVTQPLGLVDINGPTDPDAPQLAGVVQGSGPEFVAAYQVNEWDWGCSGDAGAPWYGHGCRGEPITDPPVTLAAIYTQQGAPIRTPSRHAEIHAGNYVALVVYAEEQRLTLVYTRRDTAAYGYVIHLEDICVDPALLQLYRTLDAAGRSWLPAVHSQEQVGSGADAPAKIAVRDSGSFMDPRSRKDWWRGH